jgi:hypothetical protein
MALKRSMASSRARAARSCSSALARPRPCHSSTTATATSATVGCRCLSSGAMGRTSTSSPLPRLRRDIGMAASSLLAENPPDPQTEAVQSVNPDAALAARTLDRYGGVCPEAPTTLARDNDGGLRLASSGTSADHRRSPRLVPRERFRLALVSGRLDRRCAGARKGRRAQAGAAGSSRPLAHVCDGRRAQHAAVRAKLPSN